MNGPAATVRPAFEVVRDPTGAGQVVAGRIAALLERAALQGGRVVLGCPAGRTPRTSYAALGRLAVERGLDLSLLDVVMMDEYVERRGDTFVSCPAGALHACRRFAEHELRSVLNEGLSPPRQVAADQVRFPDPSDPAAYEGTIEALGGIDLFILATGASDGHVAFNPPGSSIDSRTRVVTLAESTRRDNLSTFPSLGTLDEVPHHGVTVGLGTIVELSRSAILLVLGADKREALSRVTNARRFDWEWPATVIYACADASIVADEAAAGATAQASG